MDKEQKSSKSEPVESSEPQERLLRGREALTNKIEHLDALLEKTKAVVEAVPSIKRNLEVSRWQLNAFDEMIAIGSPPPFELDDQVARDADFTVATLQITASDHENASNAMATTMSGIVGVYTYLSSSLVIEPDNEFRVVKLLDGYQELHSGQQRVDDCKALVVAKCTMESTIERFDAAQTAYNLAIVDERGKASAAIALRTFLDGLKGELFARAPDPKKGKKTWEDMASHVAKKTSGTGAEAAALAGMEVDRKALVEDLSTVGKGWEGKNKISVEALWVRTIDFVYTALSLVP